LKVIFEDQRKNKGAAESVKGGVKEGKQSDASEKKSGPANFGKKISLPAGKVIAK